MKMLAIALCLFFQVCYCANKYATLPFVKARDDRGSVPNFFHSKTQTFICISELSLFCRDQSWHATTNFPPTSGHRIRSYRCAFGKMQSFVHNMPLDFCILSCKTWKKKRVFFPEIKRQYNARKSSTFRKNGTTIQIDYLRASITGIRSSDNVCVSN